MKTLCRRLGYAVLLVILGGCATPDAPPAQRGAPAVAIVPTDAAGMAFGLAPGTCVNGQCAPVIQLLSGDEVIDSAPLGFAASAAELRHEEDDPGFDTGAGIEAWTAGTGEGAVTTAIQPVRLTRTRVGLLVHQAAGFEHVKRRHYLFVTDGQRLDEAWSAAEGVGPAWSAAYVVADPNGQSDQIVYFDGFRPGAADPDTLAALRMVWDSAAGGLVDGPTKDLPAVIAGDFPSAEAARDAALGTCLAAYWALPGERFGSEPGRVVLAMVVPEERMAEEEMARACDVTTPRRLGGLTPASAVGKEN